MRVGKLAAFAFLLALCLALAPLPRPAAGDPAAPAGAPLAQRLLAAGGMRSGVCAVLGCRDGSLALDIARASDFLVHVQEPDAGLVRALRQAAHAEGLYGTRVVVEQGSFARLPYADNLIDLVVCSWLSDRSLRELSLEEIVRVLRPGGVAILGRARTLGGGKLSRDVLRSWLGKAPVGEVSVRENISGLWGSFVKPFPQGIDEWTHWQHGPDNNPVSKDTLIKPPYITQYLATPWFSPMPSISVIAGGRMFRAAGHMAIHEREERYLNTIYATNVFNGSLLWTRPIPVGYLAHRSLFVATAETLYLIEPHRCLLLDPQTGVKRDEIVLPPEDFGGGYWQWIAYDDGVLYALLGERDFEAEIIKRKRPTGAWGWNQLSRGYYTKQYPWGYGTVLVAIDPKTKRVLWKHEEDKRIDSRALCMAAGRIFLHSEGNFVACLDQKTGKLLWKNSDPRLLRAISEPINKGLGFKTTPYAICTDKALYFGGRGRKNVVAVSAEDGRLLWYIPGAYNATNLLFYEGKLLAHIPSCTMLDPLSGKVLKNLHINKRSCTRMTACPGYFFHRGSFPNDGRAGEGTIRYDFAADKATVIHAFRPACNDGLLPVEGMLIRTQWDCDCNLQLIGCIGLCPAGDFDFGRQATEAEHLQRFAAPPAGAPDLSPSDWATYRHDNSRSAFTPVAVARAKPQVKWQLALRGRFKPSPATAAYGLVFVAGADGTVRAIDAASGELRWLFYTAGPVRLPPALARGCAYVGSGDGYIYCLDAATGNPIWRFRAAPVERRIMVYGALCSTWPVNSGVLVRDGVAFAAAGIINYDGTHVYALDAATGKIVWQNNTSGHLNKELRCGVSAAGDLTVLDGKLWLAGGNVVSPAGYDLQTGRCINKPPGPGWPAAPRGSEICALMDEFVAVGGRRMYTQDDDFITNWRPYEVYNIKGAGAKLPHVLQGRVPPAFGNGAVAMCPRGPVVCASWDEVKRWLASPQRGARLRVRWNTPSLQNAVDVLIANDVVLAAGEARLESAGTPWAVQAFDVNTGQLLWSHALSAPPLPGGLCVDREGRIIVVQEDARVVCLK